MTLLALGAVTLGWFAFILVAESPQQVRIASPAFWVTAAYYLGLDVEVVAGFLSWVVGGVASLL